MQEHIGECLQADHEKDLFEGTFNCEQKTEQNKHSKKPILFYARLL